MTRTRLLATFGSLTPGPFSLAIWGPGLRQVSEPGTLEPGGELTVEVTMRPEAPPPESAPPVAGSPSDENPWLPDPEPSDPSTPRDPDVVPPAVTICLAVLVPEGHPIPESCDISYEGPGWSGGRYGGWTETQGRRLIHEQTYGKGGIEAIELSVEGHLPERWKVHPKPAGPVVLEDRMLDPGLTVTGRVLDEAGDPVPRARVTIGHPGADWELWEAGVVSRRGVTDADGAFRVTALPPGALELRVNVPWHGRAEPLEVKKGMSPLELVVPVRSVLRGRVVDLDGAGHARRDLRERYRIDHHGTARTRLRTQVTSVPV